MTPASPSPVGRSPNAVRVAKLHRVCTLLVVLAAASSVRALPRPSSAIPLPVRNEEQATVAFGVWLGALTDLLDSVPAPAVEHEYSAFTLAHALPAGDPKLKTDHRRLRLLFEALRDGGFWHLRWAITDQEPSSRLIWQKWIREPVRTGFAEPSATAECDESSALLGMLARHLHIYNVGLYYPTWNHTISVWAPLEGKKKIPIVQLPTTQIFLDCDAGFDKTTFHTQLKNIERYPNWDVRSDTPIPRVRAEWLLHQIRVYAAASPALWSLVRAKRAYAMGSSMGPCTEVREEWYSQLSSRLTEGDVAALRAIGVDEFGQDNPNPRRVLAWLKE